MRRIQLLNAAIIITISFISCKSQQKQSLPEIENIATTLNPLRQIAVENDNIPRTLNESGTIKWIEDGYDWTEGFWPGISWMIYDHTQDIKWKNAAISAQNKFEAHKNLTTDHDLGFIFNNSFGKAYRITGKEGYKQVIIDAAESLSTRYNEKVGCIQSWNVGNNWQEKRGWEFPVIVDNMMNLELLFEATKLTGDEKFAEVAIQHANTTMKNHFREDGSSYHVVDYDPKTGQVKAKETAQGYADESAWARGQAWALYGYTMSYRYTKDEQYLDLAEKISSFILTHPNYPDDGVPYWDFNAPNIPDEPRDASAGAILASAWIELDSYSEEDYLGQAVKILETLSSDRFRNDGKSYFILDHSVGSIPHGNEINVPLIYADYYYIEGLLRLKQMEQQ